LGGNMDVIYRLLGELEIRSDAWLLELPSGLTLTVLAVLLVNANRRVSKAELIRAVWGADEAEEAQLHKRVMAVRVALGGVAYRPWRSRTAEQALVGQTLNEETADAAAQAKFSSLAPGRAVIPSRSNREPGRTCRSVARLGLRVG